ncbi:MAG: helix-turn-helix domain-containing protein [Elusimicrobiota bacterium]
MKGVDQGGCAGTVLGYNAYQQISGANMPKTFGQVISEKRKENRWSLRELAEKVAKEDGTPISPQYLNDIEHGNRNPSGVLIDNLAKALGLDEDYLRILSGVPAEGLNQNPEEAAHFVKAYRRYIKGDRNAFQSLKLNPEIKKQK